MEKIWNLPNVLSMFRVVLIVPLGIALWNEENVIAVLIAILSAITDNLDGYFARRNNQITEFGKKIDPLADKALVGVIVVILLMQYRIPLWFAMTIVGRDVLLLLGGLWVVNKINWSPPSNALGKLTITALGLTLMFMMLNVHVVVYYGLWASTILMLVSFISYIIRAMKLLKESKEEAREDDKELL